MGNYGKSVRQVRSSGRPWDVHPVWRGIGCLLALLIPVLAYAGSVLVVNANTQNHWFPVSALLMRTVQIPLTNITVPHLVANLFVSLVLALLGYAVLMVFYAVLYSVLGPSKYSPIDSPPVRK